ncbi:hypothetical protein HKD37_09G024709 [Glycine soja]
MSLDTLFGKLHEHEMELMRLYQHEENDKKKKGIALKASSSSIQEESDEEDLNEIEEDDDFKFFVKRFNKFMRNKRNQRKSNINPKKKGEDSSLAPKCYECDQPGHLRFNCPNGKIQQEKFKKRKKENKAYITWENNDIDSLSDSENEIINLGLMAKDHESGEEVMSSNYDLSISFDELQDAFNDLHIESIKLSKLVSFYKKNISSLEKEILKLNEKLENLKSKVKILKSVDKNQSSTKCLIQENSKASHSCECCDKFKEEIVDLKIVVDKFTLGKNNLDIIFGKQRCVSYKAKLGYNLENQQKMYEIFFASTQKTSSTFLTCYDCGKKDHSASTCYIIKNGSSIGKMLWVPKGSLLKTNIQGPKKIWVPKSKYDYMNDGFLEAKLVH